MEDYGKILEGKYGEDWLLMADEIAKTKQGKELLDKFWEQINTVAN